jgi:hypothetical protein
VRPRWRRSDRGPLDGTGDGAGLSGTPHGDGGGCSRLGERAAGCGVLPHHPRELAQSQGHDDGDRCHGHGDHARGDDECDLERFGAGAFDGVPFCGGDDDGHSDNDSGDGEAAVTASVTVDSGA